MYKKADTQSDYKASFSPTNIIGAPVGFLTGVLSPTPTDQDIKSYNRNSVLSYLPGVATHRKIQRRKHLNKKYNGSAFGKTISQSLGILSSAAFLALIGSVIGSKIASNKGVGKAGREAAGLTGALLGAKIGAGIGTGANLLGGFIGTLRSPSSDQEYRQYLGSNNRTFAHLLVPGLAAHDAIKSYKKLKAQDAILHQKAE